MTPIERYAKTDEVISKFKNGKELYKNSATFNRVVQMLVRGADPLDVNGATCNHPNIKPECEFPYGCRNVCQDCGKDFTI